MIRTALLVAILCVLSSCAPRLSDGQAQALADARAGAQAQQAAVAKLQDAAAATTADPTVPLPADFQAILDSLNTGVAGFTIAATEHLELPPPTFQPTALAEAPVAARYALAGKAAQASPPKGWALAKLLTAGAAIGSSALLVLGGLLRMTKNAPGIIGIASYAANVVWDHWAPDQAKQADAAASNALDVAVALSARYATLLRSAGFGAMVDDAASKATLVAARLGADQEIAKRLQALSQGQGVNLGAAPMPAPAPPAAA